jgi:hypothetical protein
MNIWKILSTVLLISCVASAGGEFSTGGSELLKFKGYNMLRFNLYGEEDAEPGNGFRVVSEFSWNPRLNDMVTAKISLKYKSHSESGLFVVEDAHLCMDLCEGFSILGGQFKRPFGYGYTRSGSSMLFAGRPLFTGWSTFKKYGKRDIGAMLVAEFSPVEIGLAFTNGNGANHDENNTGKQITARCILEPVDWFTLGVAYGVHNGGIDTDTTNTWSSNGFDVYGVANYPVSDGVCLNFVGEYMSLGYPGDDEGTTNNNGSVYTVLLGSKIDTNGEFITAIQPAVRYEQINPAYQGDTEPENDNYGDIDFCLNLHMGNLNTLQIGGRNYNFESDDVDSYTDMYLNWRLKF